MKKLIIALGIVAAAAGVQAASFNWTSTGTATGKTINSKAGTALYSAVTPYTLYLFDAGITSQAALLAGLRDNKAITSFTSVTSQTLANNSQITAQTFGYGAAEQTYNFYFAVVDGDDVFISATKGAYGQASDTASVSFSGIGNATKNVFADSSAAFSNAGWYSTASSGGGEGAPEPTSGLLMLFGAAGLALRRKRA